MPAVHRALISYQKQNPVRVAVGEPEYRRIDVLVQGISHIVGAFPQLTRVGNSLLADRTVLVLVIDQRGVVWCDGHPEFAQAPFDLLRLSVEKLYHLLQLFYFGNAVAELPAPIIPFIRIIRTPVHSRPPMF
jgi:hypothetical protein